MKKSLLITSVVLIFTVFVVFRTGTRVEAQTRAAALFTLKTAPKTEAADSRTSIASVRESEIAIDLDGLRGGDRGNLSFPLLDGKIYEAEPREIEVRALDDYTWRGRIVEGKIENDVVLTFKKGYVSGLIYAGGRVYEIVARGERQLLVELDQSLFPECAGDLTGEQTKNAAAPVSPLGAAADSGDRIDVLVVYTTATKNFLGGDAQAQVLAQQAIDSTNAAYVNSKIRQRVRLVHAAEHVYTETTNASTDLSNLRSNAGIQALRDTHRADLVAMIGEVSGVCGIGYLMGSNQTSGNPNNGFTATARSCAVGNISFAHELGHNMGSHHNPENGTNPTYPYGFGHYVSGSYRTVMSYVDPCTGGCTRRPYFSNPEVIFNGAPTGIDNARDNARSINNTADAIANYRYSGSSLMLVNYNGGEALPRNLSREVAWTSENVTGSVRIEISRDESTNWQTLIASTPNDGAENVNVYGRPTRRARIRIVSLANPSVSDSSVRNIPIR